MTKKNNLYINIKDDDAELEILVNFLRDGEISSRSIVAIKAFYLSLAIAESPDSTPEDIRRAEHYCLSQLKQQMCYIMDKHHRDDGIDIEANEFSTVTINQSVSNNLPPLLQTPQFLDIPAQDEDRDSIPPLPLNVKAENTPAMSIGKNSDDIVALPSEDDDDDDEEEDEYDRYAKMSDAEYLAATKHMDVILETM